MHPTAAETIAKLKDPAQAQPYWMRSKEEQEVLKSAAPNGLVATWSSLFPKWRDNTSEASALANNVYILKPDYKPEPEYVDCPVFVGGFNRLTLTLNGNAMSIVDAITHPNFVGFFIIEGHRECLNIEAVATAIREGHKVVARFRKE